MPDQVLVIAQQISKHYAEQPANEAIYEIEWERRGFWTDVPVAWRYVGDAAIGMNRELLTHGPEYIRVSTADVTAIAAAIH